MHEPDLFPEETAKARREREASVQPKRGKYHDRRGQFTDRRTAAAHSGDEGPQVWMDSKFSSCVEVGPGMKPGLILRDFFNG